MPFPAAGLDYPGLLAGANEIASETVSSLHGEAVEARTTYHAGVQRLITKALQLSGGLRESVATENGRWFATDRTDAGRRLVAHEPETGVSYHYA